MLNPSTLPQEKAIRIAGSQGDLEACFSKPNSTGLIGVICHPHPLYGGTMNNKVVTTLCRTFQRLGYGSLRFNFRGVGQSAGTYGEGMGESDDVLSVIRWLNESYPNNPIALTGFSFGAYAALRAAQSFKPTLLTLIAPPVHHFDFAALKLPDCPCWLIQGDQDEIVPPKLVLEWKNTLEPPPQLITLKETSHFFHGKLIELRNCMIKILEDAKKRAHF